MSNYASTPTKKWGESSVTMKLYEGDMYIPQFDVMFFFRLSSEWYLIVCWLVSMLFL